MKNKAEEKSVTIWNHACAILLSEKGKLQNYNYNKVSDI